MPIFPLVSDSVSALYQRNSSDNWIAIAWGFSPTPGSWAGGTARNQYWMVSPDFHGVASALHQKLLLSRPDSQIQQVTTIAGWNALVEEKFNSTSHSPQGGEWRGVVCPTVGLGKVGAVNGYEGSAVTPVGNPIGKRQLDTGSIGIYTDHGALIGAVYTGLTTGSSRTEHWLLSSEYDPAATSVILRPYPEQYTNGPDFFAAFRRTSAHANWDMVLVENNYSTDPPCIPIG